VILSGFTVAFGEDLSKTGTDALIVNDYTIGAPIVAPQGNPYYFNWSDAPFKITLSESAGYNDNVLGLFNGQPSLPGIARGDMFSTTTVGASTKLWVGPQQFFVDGSYGITRYRTDVSLDTYQYTFDAGVNWDLASRCSGRLVASASQYQSPIEESLSPGINTVQLFSANETSKCLVSGYVSTIFDSGWSSAQNTQAIDALNNYNAVFVRGGLEYAVSNLDTLRAVTKFTQSNFTDRVSASSLGLSSIGLATNVDQVDYQLEYSRIFSPKLTFDGTAGMAQLIAFLGAPSNGSAVQWAPFYSAILRWQWSPKLSLGLTSARSVGAPTSVLANAQISDTQNVVVNYQLTPKISLQTGVTYSASSASTGVPSGQAGAFASATAVTAFGKAIYAITPFLTATASIQHSGRTQEGLETRSNIFLLGLSYQPM
jgi:hypothetical protein